MKNLFKRALAFDLFTNRWFLVFLLILGGMFLASASPQRTPSPFTDAQPVISKLSKFRGVVFTGFAEFRIQSCRFDEEGVVWLEGDPFPVLININNIIKVHRFLDGNHEENSSLMFMESNVIHDHAVRGLEPHGFIPLLVREEYDDITKRIRGASG
jgi:hypothetical protein